jgi:hypothetical protein
MAGTCCDLAFVALNPFDQTMFLDLPSSGRVQIQLNGVSSEYTAAGPVTLSFVAGLNVLRVITASGSVSLSGKLWGSDGTTEWLSLYPAGLDPFLSAAQMGPGGGSGSAASGSPSST